MHKIRITFLDRTAGNARAEREVAAWICRCGEREPLIGRATKKAAAFTVCPSCQRKYHVVAAGTGTGAAQKVEEVS